MQKMFDVPYVNTLAVLSANRRVVISRKTKELCQLYEMIHTVRMSWTVCSSHFILRMLLQNLVALIIGSSIDSIVSSYTAVDSASKYLYVPSSFCLGITEWYPTFLLHFEANETKSDDAANVAAYVASYAVCHDFG